MRLTSTLLSTTLVAAAAITSAAAPDALPTRLLTLHERRQQSSGGMMTVVDLTKTYQTMDGFGFSTAFQRANLITDMSDKSKQRALLDLLFNTTTGAGFSIIRTGIGSSPDSSSDHMNTFAPKNPGGPKATPQYQWDGKDSGQLFVAQEAVKYGVRTFYADAWSAPGYMKTNGQETNGGAICGVPGTAAACSSSGDWRQAYANYLVAYTQFYAAAGVDITHLGFLNEPEFSASYASMSSSGAQAADFIKILYATLQSQNLTTHLGIVCCDSEGWANQVAMTAAIRSAGAEGMLKAVSSHTYTGGASGTMATKVPVWLSEQCDLNGGWTTAWYSSGGAGEGYTWANNIYNAVVGNAVSGYIYWEGVQWPNPNTNEKLIKVDNSTDSYEVSRRLWAFANWSRYVRPGAIRVGVTGTPNGVKATAFKNTDGSVAVVVISSGGSATQVNIKIAGGVAGTTTPKEASAYVSDNTRNCDKTTASVSADGMITGSVAARSITTFVVPADDAMGTAPARE
ncbi:glycoside hydrolase superfamily [Diplogelasinospora grovesii]|uniref:Glycoside hydrolase superfamily n=1 Tax=Diplogelasinospora grovesii TaxID=303347 RepID=A0AAN6S8U0_9PEZI|nr:glycoside hydrolase superfamily [Diplogelasinospora grovesii]